MSDITPVSKEKFMGRRWRRFKDYRFALQDSLMPLLITELSHALLAFPIALVKNGEEWLVVGVAGLNDGRNYFVTQNGEWVGRYIPAVYRGYPFALARGENNERLLCFREESGLLCDKDADDGLLFFNESGEVSEDVSQILQFLAQVVRDGENTKKVIEIIAKHNLIIPWSLKIKSDDDERDVSGLYRIDEDALNTLAPDALQELLCCGAFMFIYAQLFSMQHLQALGSLVDTMNEREKGGEVLVDSNGDLDLEFLNSGDTINFGGL
ncbi:MAG: SapC family protein [Wolinella sp.]